MKLSLNIIMRLLFLSFFSSTLQAMTISCIPWGYNSKGEKLERLNLKLDQEFGTYEITEEWAIPGFLKHKGRANITKGTNGWSNIELLQEDLSFPKTRGFIKVILVSSTESFVTDYTAVFSNNESIYFWKSKKLACISKI